MADKYTAHIRLLAINSVQLEGGPTRGFLTHWACSTAHMVMTSRKA